MRWLSLKDGIPARNYGISTGIFRFFLEENSAGIYEKTEFSGKSLKNGIFFHFQEFWKFFPGIFFFNFFSN
jgi:hypothetical protein